MPSSLINIHTSKTSALRLIHILDIAQLVFLFTAALHLVGDELLVLLERLLNMQFEAHNVVEHALDLGMEFLTERVGAELELFVPGFPSLAMVKGERRGGWGVTGDILNVYSHFPLHHQLHRFA